MKDKMVWFIIGLLVGAIISTGSIFFYSLAANSGEKVSSDSGIQMPSRSKNGNFRPTGDDTPPEMPSQNNTQDNN